VHGREALLTTEKAQMAWSLRFSPTLGFSTTTSTPALPSMADEPIPDNSSIWGEAMVPPHTITSLVALTV
jgi:hypothetical protein